MSHAWTTEEDAVLRHLRAQGVYSKLIAHKIGRTPTAVDARANRLGIPFIPETRRKSHEHYTAIHVNEAFYEKLRREAARRGIRITRLVRELLEPLL